MPSTSTARLEARLPASVYATLKRAAELTGRSLSDFVITAAHEAARQAIEEAIVIQLSAEDQERFAAALLNPPPANEALQQAVLRHRDLVEVR